jgi:hypothetical protein
MSLRKLTKTVVYYPYNQIREYTYLKQNKIILVVTRKISKNIVEKVDNYMLPIYAIHTTR